MSYREKNFWAFITLFLFRYVRAVANFVAYCLYQPVAIPEKPTYHPCDLTAVIPTTLLATYTFHKVVESILIHPISALIIPTAGVTATFQIKAFLERFPDPRITVLHREEPNRREQTAMAIKHNRMRLLVICDDHTFWPEHARYLPSLVAPFEDSRIGAVGPVIEARHHHHPLGLTGFFNFLGMTYLVRRAHEFLATNSLDGGMSTLSARFAVFRAEIYGDNEFLHGYLNEYIFWGRVGPLNADDDKFHTRWLVNHGWKIKIQGGLDSTMVTELGEWPKFMG